MINSFPTSSIEQELENIKIDSHWDDETIISFYKKKTREICARLEAEEKVKKKELLLIFMMFNKIKLYFNYKI